MNTAIYSGGNFLVDNSTVIAKAGDIIRHPASSQNAGIGSDGWKDNASLVITDSYVVSCSAIRGDSQGEAITGFRDIILNSGTLVMEGNSWRKPYTCCVAESETTGSETRDVTVAKNTFTFWWRESQDADYVSSNDTIFEPTVGIQPNEDILERRYLEFPTINPNISTPPPQIDSDIIPSPK